jgi:hypothetical protein
MCIQHSVLGRGISMGIASGSGWRRNQIKHENSYISLFCLKYWDKITLKLLIDLPLSLGGIIEYLGNICDEKMVQGSAKHDFLFGG